MVCNAVVIVDEACKEGVCLIIAEGVMGCPGSVVFGKPEEVVVSQVYARTYEVRQEWVILVDHQDVRGIEEP